MITTPGYRRHDQWEVQVQAQIQTSAKIFLKTDGLNRQEVQAAHLFPIDDVNVAVRDQLIRSGPNARLCVLPEGPQTIPYLREATD